MILYSLFLISTILMLISLLFGTVEVIFLITLVTLIFFACFDKEYTTNMKRENNDACCNSKCFHTQLDCEECFSQSKCDMKNENIVMIRKE